MAAEPLGDAKMAGSQVAITQTGEWSPSAQADLARQGEALVEEEKAYGLWQAITMHKKILLYSLASYTCAMALGYDTIANGASNAMPAFSLYFGHFDPIKHVLYLDSIWISLWGSMSGLGQVLGALVAGPLSQNFGRRYVGMAFGAVSIAGVAVQFTASAKGVLLAGKMINGVAIGGLLAVGTTYASEISPPRLRNLSLGGISFFMVAAETIALGIIRSFVPKLEPSAFRTVFALQWVVAVLPIIAFVFVPESPSYLVVRGKLDAARQSLARLYGQDNSIDARLAHLQSGIRHEMELSKGTSYLDCFKGTDLKRTLTAILITMGTGLVGSAFLAQNIYFLILTGLNAIHAFDINIGGFALALLLMPFTWYYGDRFGRRSIYLVGTAVNIVVLAIVGGLGYASPLNKSATWAVAIILNLLITWQAFTVIMTAISLAPEISSYKLRQPSQSIVIMTQAFCSWLFPFVTPYMYNLGPHSGNLGAKTGFVYMGTSIVLLVLAYFYVPVIRGLSTEEMDYLYEKKVDPRRFGSVKVGREEMGQKIELRSKNSSLGNATE